MLNEENLTNNDIASQIEHVKKIKREQVERLIDSTYRGDCDDFWRARQNNYMIYLVASNIVKEILLIKQKIRQKRECNVVTKEDCYLYYSQYSERMDSIPFSDFYINFTFKVLEEWDSRDINYAAASLFVQMNPIKKFKLYLNAKRKMKEANEVLNDILWHMNYEVETVEKRNIKKIALDDAIDSIRNAYKEKYNAEIGEDILIRFKNYSTDYLY